MNKKKMMFNLLIIFLIQLFFGCETPQGHRGASDNIEESKKRKVFIKEYMAYPNPFIINDTLHITVKEAWVEKRWSHGKTEDETILYNSETYQLCINSTEKDIQGNSISWTIGIGADKYLRPMSKSSLIGDFESMPSDTIEYKVQKGDNLSDNGDKLIIGNFALFKKK